MIVHRLTTKQARFVYEIMVDDNATQAAIRSGYSRKTARQQGAQNLSKPVIRQAIQKAKQERKDRTELKVEEVDAILAKIIRADIKNHADIVDGNVFIKDFKDTPEGETVCLSEVSHNFNGEGGGSAKAKMYDRLKAMDIYYKRHGHYIERTEIGRVGEFDDKTDDELRNSITKRAGEFGIRVIGAGAA